MLFRGRKFFWGMACLQAVLASIGHAEIILHGTRVIYPSDAREVSLQLSNNGTTPSLVQAWIDDGNSKSTPDESNVPLLLHLLFPESNPLKAKPYELLHYQVLLN